MKQFLPDGQETARLSNAGGDVQSPLKFGAVRDEFHLTQLDFNGIALALADENKQLRKMNPNGKTPAQKQKQRKGKQRQTKAPVVKQPVPAAFKTTVRTGSRTNSPANVYKRTEFVADVITGSTASVFYMSQATRIQPGSYTVFPWLSQIANAFEYYKLRKLQFKFVSNQPTTVAGNVYIAVDYDPVDVAPGGVMQMSAFSANVSGSIYGTTVLDVPVGPIHSMYPWKFTRSNIIDDGAQLRQCDAGVLYAGTDGVTATDTKVGSIYVTYEIEFKTPQHDTNNVEEMNILNELGGSAVDPIGLGSGTANVDTSSTVFATPSTTGTHNRWTFLTAGRYMLNHWVYGTGLGDLNVTDGGGSTIHDIVHVKDASSAAVMTRIVFDVLKGGSILAALTALTTSTQSGATFLKVPKTFSFA